MKREKLVDAVNAVKSRRQVNFPENTDAFSGGDHIRHEAAVCARPWPSREGRAGDERATDAQIADEPGNEALVLRTFSHGNVSSGEA